MGIISAAASEQGITLTSDAIEELIKTQISNDNTSVLYRRIRDTAIQIVTIDQDNNVNFTLLRGAIDIDETDTEISFINEENETIATIDIGRGTFELTTQTTDEENNDTEVATEELLTLEELTIENAPSILELQAITGQGGHVENEVSFVDNIMNKYPDVVTAPEDIVVLSVEKLGAGDQERGIDSANMIVYGLENGVVLAVYNVENQTLEHAVGGNTIEINGAMTTLPFTIFAINDESMTEQFDGKTMAYNYGGENIPDIETAQKSIVKSLFTSLMLAQSQSTFESAKDVRFSQLSNVQKEAVLNQMFNEYLSWLDKNSENFKPEFDIKGAPTGNTDDFKAFIFNIKFQQSGRIDVLNLKDHSGIDGNAISIDLIYRDWGKYAGNASYLGGPIPGMIRTSFIHNNWISHLDQDDPSYTIQTSGMGFFTSLGMFNMTAEELRSLMIYLNKDSTWNPNTSLPILTDLKGSDSEVTNRLRVPDKYLAINLN